MHRFEGESFDNDGHESTVALPQGRGHSSLRYLNESETTQGMVLGQCIEVYNLFELVSSTGVFGSSFN